ncbi:dienelactone hydrolase family protein [Fulvivirga sp. 29W222]|uniref:Dienelactone hydrolase family protein n=1 Tax=Fulvivirga marina TaxID=2494733 RepID=A0A937FXP4_9BACT|nr:dienelactone hydrolase family protein [Fulvivirga marina]MBL6446295.1 dienelactone hydrolase family protein [Fulvivirga marina]
MKDYAFFIALLFFTNFLFAQSDITICHTSPTQAFAMFASDQKFNGEHAEPEPYLHYSKDGKMIKIKTADGKTANAYLLEAQEDSDDYLFVIHEWWGLNGHIKKMAEKYYRELGNVNVLALDLYDSKVAETREKASEYMGQADEKRVRAIIQGALDYAGNGSKIAAIGWCFGGGWALQAAMMAGNEARGAVIYYGMPEKDLNKIKEKINFPVLGVFARNDNWITPEVVSKFQKDMQTANKELKIHFYEATHAFANPSNPNHDMKAAEDAYQKSLAFLKEVLD